MSSGHAHDVKAEVRRYMLVFAALIVGTIVTVLASFIHIGPKDSQTANIVLALIIASIKGFLVAGYFMHLLSERVMIYTILVATAFFAAGLVYLTLWSMEPTSLIHDKHAIVEHAKPADAKAAHGEPKAAH